MTRKTHLNKTIYKKHTHRNLYTSVPPSNDCKGFSMKTLQFISPTGHKVRAEMSSGWKQQKGNTWLSVHSFSTSLCLPAMSPSQRPTPTGKATTRWPRGFRLTNCVPSLKKGMSSY